MRSRGWLASPREWRLDARVRLRRTLTPGALRPDSMCVCARRIACAHESARRMWSVAANAKAGSRPRRRHWVSRACARRPRPASFLASAFRAAVNSPSGSRYSAATSSSHQAVWPFATAYYPSMPTLSSLLATQIERELQTFIREIESFPGDDSVWHTRRGVTNSAGNLALHVCGNLQDFAGRVLGGTSCVRNRDRVRPARGHPRRPRSRNSGPPSTSSRRRCRRSPTRPWRRLSDAAQRQDPEHRRISGAPAIAHLARSHLQAGGYLRRIITGTTPAPIHFPSRRFLSEGPRW